MTHTTGQLTEGEIEQEIVNKGLTKGFRLTPQDIDFAIVKADYWHVPGTTTVVCALRLRNGYIVIGKSACIQPENFDEVIGKKIAYDDARNQIWALEGYALAYSRMHVQGLAAADEAVNADLFDNMGGA